MSGAVAYDLHRIDTTLNNLELEQSYYARVKTENITGSSTWSPTTKFTIRNRINNAPSTFTITSPLNDAEVQYIHGKVRISSSPCTDIDEFEDTVTKRYKLKGPGIDTLIFAANADTVYVDSARLATDRWYTLTATAHDGVHTTSAQKEVRFSTPYITALPDESEAGPSVYPNPVGNILSVRLSPGAWSWELVNMNGTTLSTGQTDPHEALAQIDVSGLHSGIYILRLTNGDTEQRLKVVKGEGKW